MVINRIVKIVVCFHYFPKNYKTKIKRFEKLIYNTIICKV